MKLVVVKKIKEKDGKKQTVCYGYIDLDFRRVMISFGDNPLGTNAELLGISSTEYHSYPDGEIVVGDIVPIKHK